MPPFPGGVIHSPHGHSLGGVIVGENMTMLGSRQEGGGGGRGPSGPSAQSGDGDSGGSYDNQEMSEPSGGFEPSAPPAGGDVPF